MTDIIKLLDLIAAAANSSNYEDEWEAEVKKVAVEAKAEIERLRKLYNDYRIAHESVALDNERLEAEIERLRAALKAAKDYIGNGYQPPELIEQIDLALKQSE